MLLECQECGVVVAPEVRWQTFSDGRRHLRAECPHCRLFLRYAEQTPETLAAVLPERPPPPSLFDQINRM